LGRWARGFLFAQAITAIGQIGWSMFDLSETVLIVTGLVWVIGAPVGFALVALTFRQGYRQDRSATASIVSRKQEQATTMGGRSRLSRAQGQH
jgi:hypothetical protein